MRKLTRILLTALFLATAAISGHAQTKVNFQNQIGHFPAACATGKVLVKIDATPTCVVPIGTYTVAALPAASSNSGLVAVVSDGTSSSDCTTGGGSTAALCYSNGTTWASIGGSSSGGGGGGIGGATTSSLGSDRVANVLNFGAVGDGAAVYDASLPSTAATWGATGTSAAPASPGGTTSFDNEVVLTVYGLEGAFTGPGTPTQRAYIAGVSGSHDGIWMGEQTVATAGAFTGNTGSQTSAPWIAINLPLIPTTGNTIAFVSESDNSTTSTALTITAPTGVSAGDAEIACLGYYPWTGGGEAYYTTPDEWSPVSVQYVSGNTGVALSCWARTVTSSEPASFSWSISGAPGQAAGFVAAYSNVAGIDNVLTSATGNFSSAHAGDLSCMIIGDPGGSTETCGSLGYYGSSTTMYPLYGNATTSTVSSAELRFAHDDTSAFTSAIAALTNGGTVYVPQGMYGLSSGITLPQHVVLNIRGSGAGLTEYKSNTSTFTPVAANGTTLDVLSKTLTTPAITIPANTTAGDNWAWTPNAYLSDFSIWSGAGTSQNPGATAGIASYTQHLTIQRVNVSNFTGPGILISDNDGTTGTYTALVQLAHCFANFNSTGVQITGSGNFNQNIRLNDNEIDDNYGSGLSIDTIALDGGTFTNNIIQWNNLSGANPGYDVSITADCHGCLFKGNWIENEAANTYGVLLGGAGNLQAPAFVSNYFDESNEPFVFSGSPLGLKMSGNYTQTGSFASSASLATLVAQTIDGTNIYNNGGANTSLGSLYESGTSGTVGCRQQIVSGIATATCYLNGYAETGTAQTWTFPFPFPATPVMQIGGGSCGTYDPTTTTTTLTLPANAGMTAESCEVVIQGAIN